MRTSWKRVGRLLAGGLVAVLIIGIAPAAPSAEAATRAFFLNNLSSKTLRLTSIDNFPAYGEDAKKNRELPPIGITVSPGVELRIELEQSGWGSNWVRMRWDVVSAQGAKQSSIEMDLKLATAVRYSEIRVGGAPVKQESGGQDLTILDPPGTRVDGMALTEDQQSSLVSNLCVRDEADCNYVLTKDREPAFGAVAILGEMVINDTCDPVEYEVTERDTRTLENNWSISSTSKVKVEKVFEQSLTIKYGGKFVSSHVFETKKPLTVRAGYEGQIESVVPVWRYTGDYTIKTDNTVWIMRGVTIDSPVEGGFRKGVNGATQNIQRIVRMNAWPFTDQEKIAHQLKCPASSDAPEK